MSQPVYESGPNCEHVVVTVYERCVKCRSAVDTATGYEYDIDQNVYALESHFKGPRANLVYLDEYQHWLKANPNLGKIIDFDSVKQLVEANWITEESHIWRGEN